MSPARSTFASRKTAADPRHVSSREDGRVLDELQQRVTHLATPPQLDELALKRLSASVRHAAEAVERDRAHELKRLACRRGALRRQDSGLCAVLSLARAARPPRAAA